MAIFLPNLLFDLTVSTRYNIFKNVFFTDKQKILNSHKHNY